MTVTSHYLGEGSPQSPTDTIGPEVFQMIMADAKDSIHW